MTYLIFLPAFDHTLDVIEKENIKSNIQIWTELVKLIERGTTKIATTPWTFNSYNEQDINIWEGRNFRKSVRSLSGRKKSRTRKCWMKKVVKDSKNKTTSIGDWRTEQRKCRWLIQLWDQKTGSVCCISSQITFDIFQFIYAKIFDKNLSLNVRIRLYYFFQIVPLLYHPQLQCLVFYSSCIFQRFTFTSWSAFILVCCTDSLLSFLIFYSFPN